MCGVWCFSLSGADDFFFLGNIVVEEFLLRYA